MASRSVADRLTEDGYSLRTLSPPESVRGPTDDVDSALDLEDAAVLERYKELSIDLYTLPCYATFSNGPLPAGFNYGDFSAAYHSRFRGQYESYDWRPSFSGKWFRLLLWATVWLAIGGQYCISKLARMDAGRQLGGWAPAVLSSALAAFTVTVVAAEIRRDLPLWTTRYVSNPGWNAYLRPSISLLTFGSWKEAAQHFQASLPILNTSAQAAERQGLSAAGRGASPHRRDNWNAWRLAGNLSEFSTSRARFWEPADVLRFEFPINNGGSRELGGWGDALAGEIFVMPVSSRHDFAAAATVESAIRDTSWNIAQRVSFRFYNCRTHVKIANHTLGGEDRRALARTYEDEIGRTQRALNDDASGTEFLRLHKRLKELLEDQGILDGPEELQVLAPQWQTMEYVEDDDSGEDLACERALFFVGDNRPFRRAQETAIPRWELSIAYCESRWEYRTDLFMMHLRGSSLLAPGLAFLPTAASGLLSRGALYLKSGYPESYGTLGGILDWLGNPEAKTWTLWLKLQGGQQQEEARALSQALADRVSQLSLFDDYLWSHQLLRYGHYDAARNTLFEVAALALGSKLLCSWMVQQLSETADLALAELVSNSSKRLRSIKGDLISTNLRERDFSCLWWVRVVVVVVAIICTRCVVASNRCANDGRSGLPWSIETIAAKAALLVRSRLREIFASVDHSPDEIRAIPGLQIGLWARQGGHSGRVWCLDTRCNHVFVDQAALSREQYKSPAIWQRHSKASLPVAAHPWIIAG
ncbi:hypothetical protein GGR58DRAFT_519645 [Xylaria digitata]|nr:hypothetical protein GGR58DRAFT_519645 [Xylaria digitata]